MAGVRRGDAGETLVEILVTLVIMGLAVSAIFAGLAVATRGSGVTAAVADAGALLTATAEQIEAATPYEGCPTDLSPTGVYAAARSNVTRPGSGTAQAAAVTISNLSIWNGKLFVPVVSGDDTCVFDSTTTGLGAADRMQRITLSQGDDTLTFIKRSK